MLHSIPPRAICYTSMALEASGMQKNDFTAPAKRCSRCSSAGEPLLRHEERGGAHGHEEGEMLCTRAWVVRGIREFRINVTVCQTVHEHANGIAVLIALCPQRTAVR